MYSLTSHTQPPKMKSFILRWLLTRDQSTRGHKFEHVVLELYSNTFYYMANWFVTLRLFWEASTSVLFLFKIVNTYCRLWSGIKFVVVVVDDEKDHSGWFPDWPKFCNWDF